jgi:hypothetical protein
MLLLMTINVIVWGIPWINIFKSLIKLTLVETPPLFKLHFQLTIVVENDLFYYNLFSNCNFFFWTIDHKNKKVQVKNEIAVENDSHLSTP